MTSQRSTEFLVLQYALCFPPILLAYLCSTTGETSTMNKYFVFFVLAFVLAFFGMPMGVESAGTSVQYSVLFCSLLIVYSHMGIPF